MEALREVIRKSSGGHDVPEGLIMMDGGYYKCSFDPDGDFFCSGDAGRHTFIMIHAWPEIKDVVPYLLMEAKPFNKRYRLTVEEVATLGEWRYWKRHNPRWGREKVFIVRTNLWHPA